MHLPRCTSCHAAQACARARGGEADRSHAPCPGAENAPHTHTYMRSCRNVRAQFHQHRMDPARLRKSSMLGLGGRLVGLTGRKALPEDPTKVRPSVSVAAPRSCRLNSLLMLCCCVSHVREAVRDTSKSIPSIKNAKQPVRFVQLEGRSWLRQLTWHGVCQDRQGRLRCLCVSAGAHLLAWHAGPGSTSAGRR